MIHRWKHLLTLLSVSLLTVSCNSTDAIDLTDGSYGVIYTSSLGKDSVFAVVDDEGDIRSSVDFKAMGVFQIGSDGNGGFLFPATLDDDMRAHIDKSGKLSLGSYDVHTFADTQQGVQVILYNTNLETNTVEIRRGNQVNRTTVPSLTRSVLVHQSEVYVFVDEDKGSYIYIIEIKTGKIRKKIPIKPTDVGAADDMKMFQGKIVAATQEDGDKLVVLDPETHKVKKVILDEDMYVYPQFVATDQKHLYVTTEEGYLYKLDQGYQVKKKVREASEEDDIYLQRVYVDDRYVYTLSIMPRGKKKAGYIGIFDKETLKRKKRIELPIIRDSIGIQDFVLLNKE
ncbi:DUF5074 domain-containing protein [Desmospora profundinema]|uniref:DNA-binding beta-propeller fold protein YncE n=1 Tax=Desmospora profundinema TaxID=1571184 RepID=A0ABU1IQG9_9BACL|nr:DUF5074 domain-containing protein [Desmospora profundinema]MDR6226169.1 DNA-binding beta-propeller fold protein YncE [Desmospora profundinema]